MNSPPAVPDDDPPSVDPEEFAKELSPFVRPGKERQVAQVVTTMIQRVHQGPLPDPETLGGYEHILPGAAERVMQMAEREQRHRHKQEGRMVAGEYLMRLFGQMGAIVAIGFLTVLAAFCAWLHEPIAAGVIVAIGAASTAFLRHSNLRQKRDGDEQQKPQQAANKPKRRANPRRG
jgi:uncharacterized membrane protein